jgi:signal peptidase II
MDSTQTNQASPARKPTLGEYLLPLIVAAIALAIDQITKRWVEATIPVGFTIAPVQFISPYLTLTNVQNSGAAFSIFQNGRVFFIIVAFIVSILIIYYAPRLPAGDWVSRLALGLQLAGALGNLIDRLRQGFATDFIHLQIPQIGFDWPVSNIADICIVSGVIILIVTTFLQERREKEDGKSAGSVPATEKPGESRQA